MASTSSSNQHVLSDKVNRALHVRTDTPAMRAALDALANLPAEEHPVKSKGSTAASSSVATSAIGGGGIIDAKSVRAAIERDALHRALQFREELRRLADDASALRVRVDAVGRAARLVGTKVESPAVGAAAAAAASGGGFGGAFSIGGVGVDDAPASGASSGDGGGDDAAGSSPIQQRPVGGTSGVPAGGGGVEAAWEEERSLASRLHGAHRALLGASSRRVAVEAFLDKFDLGESEARLLDHYNFEGFIEGMVNVGNEEGGGMQGAWGGGGADAIISAGGTTEDATAFLNALERLVIIRSELSKTFGGSGGDYDAGALQRGGDPDDEAYGGGAGGGRLGTHSALRMMEQLASRQERAHERLYQFVQLYLGVGHASAAAHAPTSSSDSRVIGGAHQVQPHPFRRLGSTSSSAALPGRFRDGDEMDEAHGHPLVRRAIHVLRHSPARRAHALELVAASRRTEVTRRFLLALTSGYDGAPAMEVRAHDPRSYVGDMLAFAFRAFRVEGELARTLLLWKEGGDDNDDDADDGDGEAKEGEEKGGKSKNNYVEDFEEDGDEDDDDLAGKPMNPAEILAQSMGGLARPLRSRISQVVSSLATRGGGDGFGGPGMNSSSGGEDDDVDDGADPSLNRLAALYSVCGLLRFYCSAVRKALDKLDRSGRGGGSATEVLNPLLTTCNEALLEASEAYAASLHAYGAMLERHVTASGRGGAAETEAHLAQRVVVRISEERVASPGFVEDYAASAAATVSSSPPSSARDEPSERLSLTFLVDTMIDSALPYLRALDDSAALRSALAVARKSTLDASDADRWTAVIEEREKGLAESLVDSETEVVLNACGLGPLRSAARRMDGAYVEGMTMASHPGLSQAEVEAAMKRFYTSLFSPPLPTFETVIKDPALRKYARSKTAHNVADAYRSLYGAITSEKGGYDDLAFLGHDPDQVKTLLSL